MGIIYQRMGPVEGHTLAQDTWGGVGLGQGGSVKEEMR